MFPPGCERFGTTINGSPIAAMTMGVDDVAFFAARTAGVPLVTITSTLRRSNSATNSGKQLSTPFGGSIFDNEFSPLYVPERSHTFAECVIVRSIQWCRYRF